MESIKKIFLEAGDGVLTEEPKKITTILGSCLTITMFHKQSGLAGISHSLYPTSGEEDYNTFSNDAFKYVDCSFEKMTKYFEMHNINLTELEVKVFGGGEVLEGNYKNFESIGKQNVKKIEEILLEKSIVAKALDIGGTKGRKIIFDTATGDVYSKRLE